jgi:hypothetical protein
MSFPRSLFHGLWTFDIPAKQWFMYEDGVQVYTSTRIVSDLGAAKLTADATKTAVIMESRLCPRYQPNRGHLFSTALWTPSKTADGIREWGLQTAENGVFFRLKADGKLYAARKSGGSENYEEEIDTSGVADFDVEKGNVYDIQYQWRGVGNYKFFINLQLVHTIASLGTLTALSMENPALPVSFRCTRTTEDVVMHVGCCDITSENGTDDSEQYSAAHADAIATNGTDKPVMVLFNPLQINSKTNTRTIVLYTLSVLNTKKATYNIWKTRDPSLITGETLSATGNGSFVQSDPPPATPGTLGSTAATVASMEYVTSVSVEPTIPKEVKLSIEPRVLLTLVRGDYLVITCTCVNGASEVDLAWGEEI